MLGINIYAIYPRTPDIYLMNLKQEQNFEICFKVILNEDQLFKIENIQ